MKWKKPYYAELLFWCAALIYLFQFNPESSLSFSFCPIHNLGFTFCPGCGIGRSMSFLLHGDISSSYHAHFLGIPAVIIITARILQLFTRIIRMHRMQHT